jgi:hypothetical protein
LTFIWTCKKNLIAIECSILFINEEYELILLL